MRPRRGNSWAAITAIVLILAVLGSTSPVIAQESDDESTEQTSPDEETVDEPTEDDCLQQFSPGLWEGPWYGVMQAKGEGTALFDDGTFTFTTDLEGFFEVTVEDAAGDASVVGCEPLYEAIDGTYEFDGIYTLQGSGPDGAIDGQYAVVGDGIFGGDSTRPEMIGSAASNGITRLTDAGGRTIEIPADGLEGEPGTMIVTLESVSCTEVYGSMELDQEQLPADGGWTPPIEGPWTAIQQTDLVRGQIDDWVKDMRGVTTDTDIEFPPYLPEAARTMGLLLIEYNSWVDTWNSAADAGEVPHEVFVSTLVRPIGP